VNNGLFVRGRARLNEIPTPVVRISKPWEHRYYSFIVLSFVWLELFSFARWHCSENQHFCRAMLCISTAYAVMRCLCVCLSVCLSRSWFVWKRINMYSNFFRHLSQAIVFQLQTAWRYSDGNPPNGGVECRWGKQKSRFLAYIWLSCLLLTLQQARCCQHSRRWTIVAQVVTHRW